MTRQLEHQEQCALFEWAEYEKANTPELAMLYAIPNGFFSSSWHKSKAVKEGLKKGVPDVCLAVPSGRYHGLYIELKVGKNKPNKDQKHWISKLNGWGYCAVVCVGWEEARSKILTYIKGGERMESIDEVLHGVMPRKIGRKA